MFADLSDEKFEEWIAMMEPLVGKAQARAYRHIRECEKRRLEEEKDAALFRANAPYIAGGDW